jgi:hypothetical protein
MSSCPPDFFCPQNLTQLNITHCQSIPGFIILSIIALSLRLVCTALAIITRNRIREKKKKMGLITNNNNTTISRLRRLPLSLIFNIGCTFTMFLSIILAGTGVTDGPSGTSIPIFGFVMVFHFSTGVLFALKLAHLNERSVNGKRNNIVRGLLLACLPGIIMFILCCFMAPSPAIFPQGIYFAFQMSLVGQIAFHNFLMSAIIYSCYNTIKIINVQIKINMENSQAQEATLKLHKTVKRLWNTIYGFGILFFVIPAFCFALMFVLPLYWYVVLAVYIVFSIDDLIPFLAVWVRKSHSSGNNSAKVSKEMDEKQLSSKNKQQLVISTSNGNNNNNSAVIVSTLVE